MGKYSSLYELEYFTRFMQNTLQLQKPLRYNGVTKIDLNENREFDIAVGYISEGAIDVDARVLGQMKALPIDGNGYEPFEFTTTSTFIRPLSLGSKDIGGDFIDLNEKAERRINSIRIPEDKREKHYYALWLARETLKLIRVNGSLHAVNCLSLSNIFGNFQDIESILKYLEFNVKAYRVATCNDEYKGPALHELGHNYDTWLLSYMNYYLRNASWQYLPTSLGNEFLNSLRKDTSSVVSEALETKEMIEKVKEYCRKNPSKGEFSL